MKNISGPLALAGLIACAVISACSTTSSGPSPANTVYATTNAYVAAQAIAIQYVTLPRCGQPSSPTLCSQQSIVNSIRVANNDASLALSAAQKTVTDPAASSSAIASAVAAASSAVGTLQGITNSVKVQ